MLRGLVLFGSLRWFFIVRFAGFLIRFAHRVLRPVESCVKEILIFFGCRRVDYGSLSEESFASRLALARLTCCQAGFGCRLMREDGVPNDCVAVRR